MKTIIALIFIAIFISTLLENIKKQEKPKKPNKRKRKTTYEEKIQKGTEYEEFVAQVYRSRGYQVTNTEKKWAKKTMT
jgi:hypothetical protein